MVVLLAIGVAGGALALAGLLRPPPSDPAAPPPPPQCGSKGSVLAAWGQRGATASATGAATGAPAGGVGAGVGAAFGLGSSLAADPCAQRALSAEVRKICKKADAATAEARKRGVALPAGYYRMSCEQKLAALAAMGPVGAAILIAATVSVNTAENVIDEAKRAGGAVSEGAKSVAKKLGF